MILGLFWRGKLGVQNHQFRLVSTAKTGFCAVFSSLQSCPVLFFLVFSSLGPVQSQSFSSLETGLPRTIQNWPENLTVTMQVSINTTMLCCEVTKVHILALMIELNRHSCHWWWCWYVCYFHSLFPQVASTRKVGFEHNSPGWVQELALTQCSEAETMTWHTTSLQNAAAALP